MMFTLPTTILRVAANTFVSSASQAAQAPAQAFTGRRGDGGGPAPRRSRGKTPPPPEDQRKAREVIAELNLVPDPARSCPAFPETFRAGDAEDGAPGAVYHLLRGPPDAGPGPGWHRVDAVTLWHHVAGAPVALALSRDDGVPPQRHVLGPEMFRAQRPQVAAAKGEWQSARSLGEWALVRRTVPPGRTTTGVEFAPAEWTPRGA